MGIEILIPPLTGKPGSKADVFNVLLYCELSKFHSSIQPDNAKCWTGNVLFAPVIVYYKQDDSCFNWFRSHCISEPVFEQYVDVCMHVCSSTRLDYIILHISEHGMCKYVHTHTHTLSVSIHYYC